MVYEYAAEGHLDDWLHEMKAIHKPVLDNVPDFNIVNPILPQFLQFAKGIASGMEHLNAVKVGLTHPDSSDRLCRSHLYYCKLQYP